jgi:hypothetical protein
MKTSKLTCDQDAAASKSLADVLDTLAYHVQAMLETPAGRTHKSGLCFGDEIAMVEVAIVPVNGSQSGLIDVWDQCKVNGRHVGNRCGARKAMMALYAPIVALAARRNEVAEDCVSIDDQAEIALGGVK